MPSRPSDQLLEFLRDAVRRKGLTTAELARRCGLERSALKRRLAGEEPLTVDDLVVLSQALQITQEEVGLAASAEPGGEDGTGVLTPLRPEPIYSAPDPLGNLPEQILRLGFALGVDLFLTLDSKLLGDSGVPRSVLGRFPEALPIRLEAKYHRHNKPRFELEGFECVLSFDSLYTCSFAWAAFKQVTFQLPTDSPPPAPEPPAPRPFLRVVK